MFDHALIVGKFAPFHRGHQLLLETALSESRRLTVLVYSTPDFVAMPQQRRAGWISTIFPMADVYVPQGPPSDDAPDLVQREFVRAWLDARGLKPDVVFTSETYGDGFASHLGVVHRLVDLARIRVPVSGLAIRSDPLAFRDFLHPVVLADLLDQDDLGRRAESQGG